MKTIKLGFVAIIVLASLTYSMNGQGCSDAGFCTLNSFKPNSEDSVAETKNLCKVGISYGKAENSISIFGSYLEFSRQLHDNVIIDAKITSLYQSGNSISAFGLSDIYLTTDYEIQQRVKLTVGVKIPLTNGNRKEDSLSLPMDYQSSLGTTDLIVGAGYEVEGMQIVAALQQPLIQNNNEFIAENYPANSKLRDFQSTNKFKRSGDVLLRISYPVHAREKLTITPSMLAIYHALNDCYTDTATVEKEISGSQGLTLNVNMYFDYKINKESTLQLNIGAPVIVRKARPDGLTRSFIANLEYGIKF